MIIYMIAAVIALGAFALVAYPLFQRRELEMVLQPGDGEIEELHSRREAVYGAIKELDFEYQLGNLSQTDYQDLRNQYRQRAASVLQEMDELAGVKAQEPAPPPIWEVEIEEAVRNLRAKGAKTGKRTPRLRAESRFCPQCGAAAGQEDRFCAACGSPMARGCPDCGAGLEAGDTFCPQCGARVAKGGR